MRLTGILLVALGLAGCKPRQVLLAPMQDNAPTLVYKTKGDYQNLVPVTLSADGKEIIAYPHPKDVMDGEIFRKPFPLKKGYWLDQQGVGPYTAFLNLTYEEYAKRTEPLPLDSMLLLVKEANPFTELYDAGPRNALKDPVEELNQRIKAGDLPTRWRVVSR